MVPNCAWHFGMAEPLPWLKDFEVPLTNRSALRRSLWGKISILSACQNDTAASASQNHNVSSTNEDQKLRPLPPRFRNFVSRVRDPQHKQTGSSLQQRSVQHRTHVSDPRFANAGRSICPMCLGARPGRVGPPGAAEESAPGPLLAGHGQGMGWAIWATWAKGGQGAQGRSLRENGGLRVVMPGKPPLASGEIG